MNRAHKAANVYRMGAIGALALAAAFLNSNSSLLVFFSVILACILIALSIRARVVGDRNG